MEENLESLGSGERWRGHDDRVDDETWARVGAGMIYH